MRLTPDLTVTKPDYAGGSLVNLMRSIGEACGAPPSAYPPLRQLGDRLAVARRLVLLVIDGFGADLLHALAPGSVFERHYVGAMTSVYPPTTASAVTTLMTGLAPQQHGLTGWFMHFRRLGAGTAVLPFMPRFAHTPLGAHGVDIAELIDCPSFFDSLACPSTALLPAAICNSPFSGLLGGQAERRPYQSLDDFAAQLLACCAGSDDAGFVYAYWSEFDRLAHLHGPSSMQVASHITDLERALSPVFGACAAAGTVLIATADHGFIDSGPDEYVNLLDHPDLADMLSLPLCGEPRSAYCYVRPRRVDSFERYIAGELAAEAIAVPSEQLIDDGWFGPGVPHPELSARVGDYTLQMRSRYTIGDTVTGERKFTLHGVHGGTAAAEMRVPLMIAGP
jgi:hypothetical protein